MLKLAVFVCLVVLCAAQTPTRPNIPETFISQSNVDLHRGASETLFGKGSIGRDMSTNEGMELTMFVDADKNNLTFEFLERYDKGMEYIIRNENDDNHCEPIKRTGSLPPYWGWVQQATYVGKMMQKHVELDKWEFSAGGTRLEVGVSESDPNTPHYFARRMPTEVIMFEILIFNATAPSASIFNVPSECSA